MSDRSRPGKTLLTTALTTVLPQGGGDKFATGTRITPTHSLPKNNTVIGTWNVRTLYACGKVKELTHELDRYRWDILEWPRSGGPAVVRQLQKKATRYGIVERIPTTSMELALLSTKAKSTQSSAACLYPAGSSASGLLRGP